MIVWNGRLNKQGHVWRYDLHYDYGEDSPSNYPKDHPGKLLCHVDSMWRRLKECHYDAINTWGYHAPSTDQMALAILGWSLCGFESDTYWRVVERMKGWEWLTDYILANYKAFADEVLANLPDNWTLTEVDVLEWLNKKEQKQFQQAVKKHKPKPKEITWKT